MTNTPETLNILDPDFRMPEHCGGDRWSILHGDSLQILRQFEPNSFDAVITDPPYNVNYEGSAGKIKNDNMASEKFSTSSSMHSPAWKRLWQTMRPFMCFMLILRG